MSNFRLLISRNRGANQISVSENSAGLGWHSLPGHQLWSEYLVLSGLKRVPNLRQYSYEQIRKHSFIDYTLNHVTIRIDQIASTIRRMTLLSISLLPCRIRRR